MIFFFFYKSIFKYKMSIINSLIMQLFVNKIQFRCNYVNPDHCRNCFIICVDDFEFHMSSSNLYLPKFPIDLFHKSFTVMSFATFFPSGCCLYIIINLSLVLSYIVFCKSFTVTSEGKIFSFSLLIKYSIPPLFTSYNLLFHLKRNQHSIFCIQR